MAVSDEELEQKRQHNAKLREQIAAEDQKKSERLRDQHNAIQAAQLDAETARLEAQLAAAKESAKAGSVKEGASGVLDEAKEQMKAAQAQRDNQTVGPVDTNKDKE